jgi:hypothetical protein
VSESALIVLLTIGGGVLEIMGVALVVKEIATDRRAAAQLIPTRKGATVTPNTDRASVSIHTPSIPAAEDSDEQRERERARQAEAHFRMVESLKSSTIADVRVAREQAERSPLRILSEIWHCAASCMNS